MGAASRRKKERAETAEERANARAERALRANETRLNHTLTSLEASPVEMLDAHIRFAPTPHGLDELMTINEALTHRGWQLQVHGWDGITWTSPRTQADDRWEQIQEDGGWHELNVTTDVFFSQPAYLLTLPQEPHSPTQSRFFTSRESLYSALDAVEAHTYGDDPEKLWELLEGLLTAEMPGRGPQIAMITPDAELPYPTA